MVHDLVGKRFGGCDILGVIGRGGMAVVYRAHQLSMNRAVAIKMLPKQFVDDATYLQRFEREVRIVAQLEHRNIVPVHDYGEFEGQPYIVMRLMDGGSVDDLLRKHRRLALEQIENIITQIAPALDYAHAKGVLHRDLKPSNILLDDDGGFYLSDFGIARLMNEAGPAAVTLTSTGVIGTPSYMSPEQAQGRPLDGRSDIYALGVCIFEMATGARPFEGETPYSIAVHQVTTAPPRPRSLNPDIPPAVETVILKAMSKRRDERHSHAVALAFSLRAAIAEVLPNPLADTQPNAISLVAGQAAAAEAPPTAFMRPAGPSAPTGTPSPFTPGTPMLPPPVYVAPRRPRRGGLLFSALLGALIGCALLAILAGAAVVALNLNGGALNATATASSTPTASLAAPTLLPTRTEIASVATPRALVMLPPS